MTTQFTDGQTVYKVEKVLKKGPKILEGVAHMERVFVGRGVFGYRDLPSWSATPQEAVRRAYDAKSARLKSLSKQAAKAEADCVALWDWLEKGSWV